MANGSARQKVDSCMKGVRGVRRGCKFCCDFVLLLSNFLGGMEESRSGKY